MASYRILLVASISSFAAGAAAAQAPAKADSAKSGPAPAMQLTALDYIEIEQLTRKYAWAIDTCSNDGFDYADLYTPDGAFVDGQTGRRYQGRNQLAEAAGGNGRGCPFPKMPLSHLILNLVVEPTADGAVGKKWWRDRRLLEWDPWEEEISKINKKHAKLLAAAAASGQADVHNLLGQRAIAELAQDIDAILAIDKQLRKFVD